MTLGQGVEIGPFHFTFIRILIGIAIVRVVFRRERLYGGIIGIDLAMIAWGIWALMSGIFYENYIGALIFRLGLVYNTCGIYCLFRVFIQSKEDIVLIIKIIAILLIGVAGEMIFEKMEGYNLFSIFGGVAVNPETREGIVRAQGPFSGSILAGTVGATCFPLMVGLNKYSFKKSIAGSLACCIMVLTSGSSGPIVSALSGIFALFLWFLRNQLRIVRWLGIIGYIGLDVVMKAPAYYIIWRFNIFGKSTGWHRAALIDAAIEHVSEWWIAGTDYTRHWLSTGVSWSPNHVDITNHYIKMGIWGGLPLMVLFIIILIMGFRYVGKAIQKEGNIKLKYKFLFWSLGASLFAHAATCMSVSYFDQSVLFLYLVLATINTGEVINRKGQRIEDNYIFEYIKR